MWRNILLWVMPAIFVLPISATALPGCAASVAAAVGNKSEAAESGVDASGGYRVVHERWDALLGVRWAMVEQCGHPERPWQTVVMGNNAQAKTLNVAAVIPSARVDVFQNATAQEMQLPLMVRAGQTVVLWSADEMVHVALRATAEENGRAGQQIWLRLEVMGEGQNGSEPNVAGGWKRRRGVVRGAGSVELVP